MKIFSLSSLQNLPVFPSLTQLSLAYNRYYDHLQYAHNQYSNIFRIKTLDGISMTTLPVLHFIDLRENHLDTIQSIKPLSSLTTLVKVILQNERMDSSHNIICSHPQYPLHVIEVDSYMSTSSNKFFFQNDMMFRF